MVGIRRVGFTPPSQVIDLSARWTRADSQPTSG